MPRQKNTSEQEILNKAMQLFWQKGYQATSYDDLIAATGSTRYALYSSFGDKDALFQAAVKHYQDTAIDALLVDLERPDANLAEVKNVFTMLLENYRDRDKAGLGCFIANTALERSQDPVLSPVVKAQLMRYQRAFYGALVNAEKDGHVLDAESLADYLIGIMQAGSVLHRMEAELSMIENLFEEALMKLP